jgi:hypothetical protein
MNKLNKIIQEQAKAGQAYHRKMRSVYRREHPGDELPEHFCELDHPYPGFKRWAAKVKRWIDNYEREHPY